MTYPWLAADFAEFPSTKLARTDPNGLLAAGGDLTPDTLLHAYSQGIFPWYNEDDPILWWTPSPRCVLLPNQIHISKSLRKHLRRCDWHITVDRCFADVIEACAAPRAQNDGGPDLSGTWISDDMISAYQVLHTQGFAHSVEVWQEEELVGGLYGIALGQVFFGESMFSRASNASKTALVYLARWLRHHRFALIDCQVENPHLQSLGAKSLERPKFEHLLNKHVSIALIEPYQQIWQDVKNTVLEEVLEEQT